MTFRAVFPLLLLIGCPEEPTSAPLTPGGPGEGAPPGGQGGPPPAEGTTPPAEGTAPPAEGGSAAPADPSTLGMSAPTPPAGLASLIKDGKKVTIHGKLVGAKAAQVDIQTTRESGPGTEPELLEIIKVTDGTFTVEAPATFNRPLYITAMEFDGKEPLRDGLAGASAAVKLEGKDVNVEIKLSKGPDWIKKLPWGDSARRPAGEAPAPPPDGQGGAPGTPPPGGAPGGPPPGGAPGAPPSGAPGAGAPGAAPAGGTPAAGGGQ